MALPEPIPGLVIRYSYLWRREYLAGQEEGQKDRPCAIVAAIRNDAGTTRVLVLPVTHTRPDVDALAIEIPPTVGERLGLDERRSWIVVSEYNEFVWPGPDIRPLADGSIAYGTLPPGLFQSLRELLLKISPTNRPQAVRRTE